MTLVESIMNIIGRILGDLLANLLAGIVGSLLTWLFVVVSTRLAQRRKFADYAGRYETYTVEGSRISDEFINVK